jgi:aminopeptidase N
MRRAVLAAAMATAASLPCAAQPRFDFDRTPGLLSTQVVPLRYSIRLDVDPEREPFAGRAAIELDVRAPVPAIVLHARDLEPTAPC